ncbi:MAG TPA: hypothetical protein EYP46_03950 [Hadesarchaea archaeon]|nr:hypothetical protein [Hadesarchaea archaeon]
MAEKSHPAVYYIDVVVAIFLLITGVFVLIVGVDYFAYLAPTGGYGATIPIYATVFGYMIITLGITAIIYGIKRLIDDVIKARS